ncbi:MFS transporter [Bacillus sp. DTU_2020_1000418_1_SI_GHA_SEK_038]|uniref:MFS transporter n=1 Tax=Bacillus sp. DTU_2020_1000418_1_SI_GHA_SEK_038 TaxID=3077585 RepID=UPI0028E60502|nr:MFS transporter [Bacillus sp. DTU_2020_1000418_1_SI_GHA_SEK_038]WNS75380.1 MFS transporter [Bacillus sp. DTU_2020_1000418_1_SI_GHA_SEK_038]
MWRNKNVWIILCGELIAGLGLWMGIIGNLEFMQEKVPSDFMKSVILAIGLLAGILAGPIAGRITDQKRKKTVMIYAGLGRMVSVLFMFISLQTGSILWLVVFVISIQVAASFYFPALQAAIPLIVDGKDLLRMNGVHMNVATIARILGTSLAGILLVAMSLFMLYLTSFIAYFFLFLFTLFLKIDEPAKQKNTGTSKSKGSFKEVLPVIKGLPIVLMTLVLSLVPLLFLGGFNLLVIKISEIHDDQLLKGIIYAAEGIAFMIGAFAVKKMSDRWSPYSIMFFFSLIVGFAQISLFFVDSKIVTIAAFAVVGFSVGCFYPTAATIFQTRMPKEFHGRFFSFRSMLDRVMFQVVLLGTGFLLDLVGMQMMVVIFGIISAGLTAIFYLQFKRHIGHEDRKKAVSF